jgi:hypothetical protein
MQAGLKIVVVDPDDDYLGVEIFVASDRFSGATRIYAGLDELSQLADTLTGFPQTPQDERQHDFGTRNPGFAGGFARLRFFCIDSAGHAALEVTIDDDHQLHSKASATFQFAVVAASIDVFVAGLRAVEQSQSGEAFLPGTV